MALYCSEEIFRLLSGLPFPTTRAEILKHCEKKGASKRVLNLLDLLEERVRFQDIGGVCENVKIVCSLAVFRALEGLQFPADKEQILTYASSRGADLATFTSLEELPEGYSFRSIGEVCENVL
jgi:hypothetical protein